MPKFKVFCVGQVEREIEVEAVTIGEAAINAVNELDNDHETNYAAWTAIQVRLVKENR